MRCPAASLAAGCLSCALLLLLTCAPPCAAQDGLSNGQTPGTPPPDPASSQDPLTTHSTPLSQDSAHLPAIVTPTPSPPASTGTQDMVTNNPATAQTTPHAFTEGTEPPPTTGHSTGTPALHTTPLSALNSTVPPHPVEHTHNNDSAVEPTTTPSLHPTSNHTAPSTAPAPALNSTAAPQTPTTAAPTTTTTTTAAHHPNTTTTAAPHPTTTAPHPTTTAPHPTTTTTTTSPTTTTLPAPVAKTSPGTAPEFNVGDDESSKPTPPRAGLDPLLAGLVSVFIVAAVVVSLLLFLRFRRRDTQPEFRRLQDLPMDDMMEDTPLSMYSY
ncbi:uncharacterized protein LOC136714746 isoform X2 [Amia ocellicauda]|uniref:uncharacterized protein LOC136714746 isoform X2 n=1 Tax=Amia ocellicauda TaxID=2972642 RepID=UPI0034638BF5